MRDKIIGKIVTKMAREILVLSRWLTNYIERTNSGLDDETRDAIKDIRSLANQLERDLGDK